MRNSKKWLSRWIDEALEISEVKRRYQIDEIKRHTALTLIFEIRKKYEKILSLDHPDNITL